MPLLLHTLSPEEQASYHQKRRADDLEAVRAMQLSLLPDPLEIERLERAYGLVIQADMVTAEEMGGDMWLIRPIDEERVAVMIADFTGHGVRAAMTLFRFHTLLYTRSFSWGEPAQFLSEMNHALRNVIPFGQFASVFYAVYHRGQRTLRTAAAASTSPLWIQPATQSGEAMQILELSGKGFPLAAVESATFQEMHYSVPRGTILMLYSDALIETETQQGNHLTEAMMIQRIQCIPNPTSDAIFAQLQEYKTLLLPMLQDDLTMLMVEFQ